MIGQMTYNPLTKSWEHIPLNKMTTLSCQLDNTIQSREGYYRAWSGELVMGGTLQELIIWVEKNNKKNI